MAKLLVAVVALATLGFLAYHAMYSVKVVSLDDQVAHAPKRQLDNVREKVRVLGAQDQKNADDLSAGTGGEPIGQDPAQKMP
jgi:curli biogenesis system outer membrane secretion channel CsgG